MFRYFWKKNNTISVAMIPQYERKFNNILRVGRFKGNNRFLVVVTNVLPVKVILIFNRKTSNLEYIVKILRNFTLIMQQCTWNCSKGASRRKFEYKQSSEISLKSSRSLSYLDDPAGGEKSEILSARGLITLKISDLFPLKSRLPENLDVFHLY